MPARHHLACDLGAESGRLMLGTLDAGRIALEEIHRFPNAPIKAAGSLHWNVRALFEELKMGLKKAAGRGRPIASISTDSWGVDYVLLDAQGGIIEPVFHYRDPRSARGIARAQTCVSWETIFAETGIQQMPLNTLYQLAAEPAARLARAAQLLLVGDAFNYWLNGVACAEESLASTTQLYNPLTRDWSGKLLDALALPRRLFPRIVPAGTRLGPLLPALAQASGLGPVEVIATCSHDTGAAVAAVPAQGEGWAYLSSGTWSLMGVELEKPILSDACRELNFTNEIGHGGSVRLLKNISGLWLVQECRRAWAAAGHDFDYVALTQMAADATPFRSLINPADARFLAPDEMPERIAGYCRATGQPAPETPGEFIRCALESLALLYRRTLGQIETLTGRRIERLHIVGGGSRNHLLNQFAANALQIPALTGPVEATALGNVLVQALALGDVPSLAAGRELIRASVEVQAVSPQDCAAWAGAAARFEQICRWTGESG